MSFLADGMASSMTEEFGVASLVDHFAGRMIYLPTLDRFFFEERAFHSGNGRVAGFGDDLKYLLIFLRHVLAHKAGPGQIAVHRSRLVEFRPQVNKYETAFADDAFIAGLRFIMRVTGVWPHGTDRR